MDRWNSQDYDRVRYGSFGAGLASSTHPLADSGVKPSRQFDGPCQQSSGPIMRTLLCPLLSSGPAWAIRGRKAWGFVRLCNAATMHVNKTSNEWSPRVWGIADKRFITLKVLHSLMGYRSERAQIGMPVIENLRHVRKRASYHCSIVASPSSSKPLGGELAGALDMPDALGSLFTGRR